MPARNTFLICTRDTDTNDEFTTEPGQTTFLKVPAGKTTYSRAESITAERWKKAVIAAADGEEDEITGSTGDIVFFVHGYNNAIPTVLWRTRTLQDTLAAQGWKGLVVGFDWPSDNSTLNYLEDRMDASSVSLRLVDNALQLLVDAQFPGEAGGPPCTINVHLLGHSTGAYVIMEAFAQAAKKGDFFKKNWRIGQVAFIGGDVSSRSLAAGSDWAAPMYERIFRLTNYSNRLDKVLGVSNMKRLGTAPRAGRVGLPDSVPYQGGERGLLGLFLRKESGPIGLRRHLQSFLAHRRPGVRARSGHDARRRNRPACDSDAAARRRATHPRRRPIAPAVPGWMG